MPDTLIKNVRIASMQVNGQPFGELKSSDIRIVNGKIEAIGSDLEPTGNEQVVEGKQRWCLPGFIDCHTHLVYAGSRANEFSQRLSGVSYEDISNNGGGIKSTVRATRKATDAELLESTKRRGRRLAEEGVTTIEIKSGYGLDKDTEVRMLKVATQAAKELQLNVQRTFLGAHTLPPDGEHDANSYIDFICHTMIPYIAEHQLADAVDVFCERIGFDLEQTERVFCAAKKANLAVKGHVEQLSDSKGAALAARYGAISVDHIEYLHTDDLPLLKKAGSVAVLLPGAFYYLRETRKPPVASLREWKIPMAVSTDMNPGTSPMASLLTAANMACVLFALTTDEALRGITVNAAKALGLSAKGVIQEGKDADLCLWSITAPDELVYEINGYRPDAKWVGGNRVL